MPRSPILASLIVLVCASCYRDPNAQLDAMQQTLDLESTLEDLSSRTADLQVTLDSLRGVIARQDTTIRALANLAGVPYTP